MKEKKILEALNDIDDKFIEEANPEEKKVVSLVWAKRVACFILAVFVGFAVWDLTKKPEPEIIIEDDPPQSEADTGKGETEYTFDEEGCTEIAVEEGIIEIIDEDFWKNLSINQQYNNVSYKTSEYYNNNTKIKKSDIGEKIKDSQATGTDPFDNKVHTKEASIYRIKTVSDKCAVAVKFEENENYFVYVNRFCEFETLGEIIDNLSLDKNMKVVTGFYREKDVAQIKYENLDSSVVVDMLLENRTLEAMKEPDEILLSDFLFEIKIPPVTSSVGNTVSVMKKGYLLVNIFHAQHIFFIGEEKAEKFINYVTENYKGKKLVATTEPTVVYNGAKEEPLVTEIFSDGYKP